MALGVRRREKEGEKLPTRYYSKLQEDAVAKKVNGRTTANSGATNFGGKGDILTDEWLLECKTRTSSSESISIKKDWFQKNREEMVFEGKKYQAVVFNFGPNEENHYIIDEYLFLELQEHLRNRKEN